MVKIDFLMYLNETLRGNRPSVLSLIGMSGVGKTAIGQKLSTALGYQFIDTDKVISEALKTELPAFIQKYGDKALLEKEEEVVSGLTFPLNTEVATGGSVVYSEKAMENLRQQSYVIYLQDSFENITRRTSLKNLGIISPYSSQFEDIYLERIPLYEQYAHHIFDMPFPFNGEKAVANLMDQLNKKGPRFFNPSFSQ